MTKYDEKIDEQIVGAPYVAYKVDIQVFTGKKTGWKLGYVLIKGYSGKYDVMGRISNQFRNFGKITMVDINDLQERKVEVSGTELRINKVSYRADHKWVECLSYKD